MKRWIVRIVFLGILSFASLWAYNFYRAGYLSLPDLPDGAYTLSYKNGFRAIITDANISDPRPLGYEGPKYFRSLNAANPERKYLGVPFNVQSWFEGAWSWCKSPTNQEKEDLNLMPDDFKRQVANARFEAVCRISVDDSEVVRGLIFSVPRL